MYLYGVQKIACTNVRAMGLQSPTHEVQSLTMAAIEDKSVWSKSY
jgi:hypothetical protein